ncbi:VOC family protein [Botryobacter ruber]|uniref:VOC family protein n=1 Tax=Botryobacter ruber TaxID=2171629 RepID=UPI000E0BE4EC|nr:VOC family protein [Botryobacter ruber]
MLTFNHIALHVHDLQQSTAFYEQVMQLQKIPDPFNDDRHAWYSLGAPLQLHLIQGAPKEIRQDIKRHLCFSADSLDEFMKSLSRHNIRYYNKVGVPDIETIRPDGIRQLYIQDPDGYWLEINDEIPG